MTTSGTKTFSMDVAQIIEQAFFRVGGNPISGEEAKIARFELNLLLLYLISKDAPLSARELKTFSTVAGTSTYTLPDDVINVQTLAYNNGSIDIELTRDDMNEYLRIPNKTQQGQPNRYFIDRGSENMTVYLYQVPNNTYTISYWATTRIEDVTKAVETIDLPPPYLPAIVSGLAYRLSFIRRNIDAQYRQELKDWAAEEMKTALEEDRTRTTLYIKPKAR